MTEIHKEVQKSKDLLMKYKSGDRTKWAKQAHEDREFKANKQWSKENQKVLEARDQMAIPVNEIMPSINLVRALLTENDPRFTSVGRESSDSRTAGNLGDLFAWIWDVSDGNEVVSNYVDDGLSIGMGCTEAYVDPYADKGKGEIMIIDIDPNEVYFNPNTKKRNGSDSSDIIHEKFLTRSQVEVIYPNFSLEGANKGIPSKPTESRYAGEDQVLTSSETHNEDKFQSLNRYTKIKVKRYHVYDPSLDFEKVFTEKEFLDWSNQVAVIVTTPTSVDNVTDDEQVQYFLNLVRTYGNIFHMMINPDTEEPEMMSGAEHDHPLVVPNSTTRIEVVDKGYFVEQGFINVNTPLLDRIRRVFSIGDKLVTNHIMEITDPPIVSWMLHHNRNPYPMGDIRYVKPLQEQLNKVDNLIITYNQNITNVKMFVQRNSGLKKELDERGGKAGFQVFETDLDTDKYPFVVQLTQMSNAFYQQRENLIAQIQRIIGAYSFQDGNASQAPQTKGGTILIDEVMQRRTAEKRRFVERSLNQLAKVISQLIPYVYTEEKVVRLIVPNHETKEVVFNQRTPEGILNDITQGEYDIKIISGSMLPTNKMMRREELKEYYINGIIKDPTPIIRELDLPNVDEILQREDTLKQAEQYINQLTEQIKKLEGDAETSQRELVTADRQIEKAKFDSQLDKILNTLKANLEIGKARITDAVTEVKTKNKEEKNEVKKS